MRQGCAGDENSFVSAHPAPKQEENIMVHLLLVAGLLALLAVLCAGSPAHASIVIPYADRKGEHGRITLNQATAFSDSDFLTFVTAKSYAGFEAYSEVTETDFDPPKAIESTVGIANDKDVKLVLGFEGAEGNFKIEIPCPKINISGGFVIRWGEKRAYVPPVKEAGETGDDGTTIAGQIATILGQDADDVKFRYGRLTKKG
jgi:hypothetical protein